MSEGSSAPSSFVTAPSQDQWPSSPRAVVLVLGWFGGEHKHLSKYSDLYHSASSKNRNCITVQGIMPSVPLMTQDRNGLIRYGKECMLEVVKVLRAFEMEEKTPPKILIHGFSNGGAMVMCEMRHLLDDKERSNHVTDDQELKDVKLFSENLCGYFYDSAPAYPSVSTARKALAGAFERSWLYYPIALSFEMFGLGLVTYQFATRSEGVMDWFWKAFSESTTVPYNQAFIYSTEDKITLSSYLEDFIQKRESIVNNDKQGKVLTLNLKDSAHVQHLRKYPTEYEGFVDTVLDTFVQ